MFIIGDKVVMATIISSTIPVGAKGVVQDLHDDGVYNIVVDFGDEPSRYGGRIGRGWCMAESELEHDKEQLESKGE